MGASHATLSSASEDATAVLQKDGFAIEERLYPGSGRMMRSFRLQRKNGSLVVAKCMWTSPDDADEITKQQEELARIKEALQEGHPHVAPFVHWSVGEPITTGVRAVALVRDHVYTTLSDRLESRPFLTNVEKLYMIHQLLSALQRMHDSKVMHGFLTTENIGLTSWNHVVILDIASYKARVALPDDDPSEYLYYYQEFHSNQDTNTQLRCYLAPERFYSPKSGDPPAEALTPAMDIFSTGCIILETWLNGERALDLGDLMDYRKGEGLLPQKLQKIESSSLRAACKHMLSLEPEKRLTPREYLERLQDIMPSYDTLEPLMERLTQQTTPDARMALAAANYPSLLQAATGHEDEQGKTYFAEILGPTLRRLEKLMEEQEEKENARPELTEDLLLKETEALLKKLANLDLDAKEDEEEPSSGLLAVKSSSSADDKAPKSSSSTLLIFVQLILANLRHVNRPSSKLVGLQLLRSLAKVSSDETRLQRMLPSTIFLLNDQDPLVRALALEVMTTTLSQIQSFPPSDSKIFPQYVFKRVAHLLTDPSLVVRAAFSQCLAVLAETSRRFLDISHAVRLYEAVGGGGTHTPIEKSMSSDGVFGDDVAKLLDGPKSEEEKDDAKDGTMPMAGHNTLISNTYDAELSALHEVVSRWVLHITTSEQSSAPKRALLGDLARLCNFFDREGVMAFILPQILAFLNERRDWQLRAALFDDLPAACYVIGRAATEHFVLPCLETALVDSEDQVLRSALMCLSTLVDQGLLSRSVLVDTRGAGKKERGGSRSSKRGALVEKYSPLLLFPVDSVRHGAILFINSCCKVFGSPDAEVFLVPVLRPYLRFEPLQRHLTTKEGLEKCLVAPWTSERLETEMSRLIAAKAPGSTKNSGEDSPELDEQVKEYLTMIARSRANRGRSTPEMNQELQAEIEGSLKLSQNVKFPTQVAAATLDNPVPTWFENARAIAKQGPESASACSSLQSVAALNQVYGLSIMRGSEETPDILPADTVISEDFDLTEEELAIRMTADAAKEVDAAFSGEWGSECVLDPDLTTTTSLVGKLKSLDVPTLSPRLGVALENGPTKETLAKGMGDWRPKVETLIASSSPVEGHSGPVARLAVSQDQRFFVSGSFDSTCKVWELGKIDNSSGIMNSSATYVGHGDTGSERPARVNDIAVLEGSHSVASASSDGNVHVWRVDLVTSRMSSQPSTTSNGPAQEHSRVSGSSVVRTIDSTAEGEVLAVSHYNTLSESILAFATQRGSVHTWDLRSEKEPFHLKHPAELGYMTSMALGTDRNWIVTGTSKGFVALWDIRWQNMVKLWRHSGAQPITRLATSYAQIPGARTNSGVRPLMFLSSGSECGMYDVMEGACRQGFRVLGPQSGYGLSPSRVELATLKEIQVSGKNLNSYLRRSGLSQKVKEQQLVPRGPQLNAMVGSMGGYDQNYLITGGGDAQIRYWDFSNPSKCYTVSGQYGSPSRPNYERVDFPMSSRLMVCRQTTGLRLQDLESSRVPRRLQRGLTRVESRHQDAILDLKLIQTPIKAIVSCSRDGTIKLFK